MVDKSNRPVNGIITDEIVERAARAQWDALRDRADGYVLGPFESLEPERRADWLAETRAGLEAVVGDIIEGRATSEAWLDADVVGAIRLALTAASGPEAMIVAISRLLSYAPESDSSALGPARLLMQAIQETADLRFTVSEP